MTGPNGRIVLLHAVEMLHNSEFDFVSLALLVRDRAWDPAKKKLIVTWRYSMIPA